MREGWTKRSQENLLCLNHVSEWKGSPIYQKKRVWIRVHICDIPKSQRLDEEKALSYWLQTKYDEIKEHRI